MPPTENAMDERLSDLQSLYRMEPDEKKHLNCIIRLEEKFVFVTKKLHLKNEHEYVRILKKRDI
jgi:hypothetical protein